MISKYYTFSTLVLMLISFSSCNSKSENETIINANYCIPEEFNKNLTFENVTERPIQQSIILTGTIEYNKDKTVPFFSLVEGTVVSTHFNLGDFVKKGQLLAEIKSTELNEFKTELKITESELKVAKRALESVNSMYKDGLASQKELVETQEEVQVIETKLRAAKSNLSMFNGQNKEGIYQILAPQDGYIVTKNIVPGMTTSGSEEPLFIIADLSNVWIMANVYATNMRYVEKNTPVSITTLAYPDDTFKGKISSVSQVFDAEERVLKATIEMNNESMKLRPGMSAEISLLVDNNKGQAIAVPNNAIIFDNNQNYVIVYTDNCHQEIRQINPIAKNSEYTYISGGVANGEKVITSNELLIYQQLNNQQ